MLSVSLALSLPPSLPPSVCLSVCLCLSLPISPFLHPAPPSLLRARARPEQVVEDMQGARHDIIQQQLPVALPRQLC